MKKKYRIVIAEDHTILREGLKSLLSLNRDIEIVGEAENGFEAIKCVQDLKPDLILLDLSMPKMNGLEAISEIKSHDQNVKIIILTVHKTEEYIFESLKAGADGYVLKDATSSELMLAIESVIAGKIYTSPDISGKLVQGYLSGGKTRDLKSPGKRLTKRERQVLKLIAEGYQNKKIADYLYISVKTVEKHRSNLMKKLNLHNASELTSFAISEGIV